MQLGAFWTHVSTSGLILKLKMFKPQEIISLCQLTQASEHTVLARCDKMSTARSRLLTICVGLVNGPSRL